MLSLGKLRSCIGLVLVACLVAGCSPEARKKRYVKRGSTYFEQAKYREAVIEYENALQIDSRYGDAHYGLAQCFLKQGDWTHAYQQLINTVEYEPTNWKAQLSLASLLFAAHHNAEAHDRAQTVLNGDPLNVEAQELLAGSDAAGGDLPKGISEAEHALQMDPNRSGSYLLLGELLEQKKDITSAEQRLSEGCFPGPEVDARADRAR